MVHSKRLIWSRSGAKLISFSTNSLASWNSSSKPIITITSNESISWKRRSDKKTTTVRFHLQWVPYGQSVYWTSLRNVVTLVSAYRDPKRILCTPSKHVGTLVLLQVVQLIQHRYLANFWHPDFDTLPHHVVDFALEWPSYKMREPFKLPFMALSKGFWLISSSFGISYWSFSALMKSFSVSSAFSSAA